MAMKLSEVAEVLDDRIDEFKLLVQDKHQLDDAAFGNPCLQSPSEIVAVGRIASDSSEGRLNVASLVLETSRRTGSGKRIPLRVDALPSYQFFPGQMVAVRGTNASGDFFTVSELLALPLLPEAATVPAELETCNARLLDSPSSDSSAVRPLSVFIAAGPYTTDDNLDFAPLHALLDEAAAAFADALVLVGPFLDAEHPLVRTGNLDVPPHVQNPDAATLADVFKHHVSAALQGFAARVPMCSVVVVPSLRDAVHRHAAFPQDRLPRKELALPRQAHCVTSPMTLSMNEFVVGMTGLDVFDIVRREECAGGAAKAVHVYDRAARSVLEQRSFLPVFPPTSREKLPPVSAVAAKPLSENGDGPSPVLPLGTMLDTSYVKLADMLHVRPDVLIVPSVLGAWVRVCRLCCCVWLESRFSPKLLPRS